MQKSSKGFTLIEMLVVITILGIMILFAVPSFVRVYWERSRSSVNEMAQEFRKYRERALAQGIDYVIEFRPATADYQVHIMETPSRTIGPFFVKGPIQYGTLGGGVPRVEEAPGIGGNGVHLNDGTMMLTFNCRGGSIGGAVYFNDRKEDFAIGIWRTGRIKVWKWTGADWF